MRIGMLNTSWRMTAQMSERLPMPSESLSRGTRYEATAQHSEYNKYGNSARNIMRHARRITEQLKASDQMKWIGLINNIRSAAEEVVLNDLIYV